MFRSIRLFAVASIAVACGSSSPAQESEPNLPAPPAATAQPPAPPASMPTPPPPPPADSGAPSPDGRFLLIVSAFPAENLPLLAEATITSTTTINGKTFRIGTLKGVKVAIGLVGMGLTSATATAKAALAALPVTGVIFSGVAGSKARIGDVAVASSWSLKGTATYTPDAAWLALANGITPCMEKCTVVPATGLPVCLDHVPSMIFGITGESTDTQAPVSCNGATDDVFGCDVGTMTSAPGQCDPMGAAGPAGGSLSDNETAAVAAEAAAKKLPFIAFRGISDGAGDPLGLPGYPAEFFAYYRLAAHNAAAATIAFVGKL